MFSKFSLKFYLNFTKIYQTFHQHLISCFKILPQILSKYSSNSFTQSLDDVHLKLNFLTFYNKVFPNFFIIIQPWNVIVSVPCLDLGLLVLTLIRRSFSSISLGDKSLLDWKIVMHEFFFSITYMQLHACQANEVLVAYRGGWFHYSLLEYRQMPLL